MNAIKTLAMAAASIVLGQGAGTAMSQTLPAPGDTFEIKSSYETSSKGSNSSSGSSSGHTTMVERVIAVTDAGVELEYDLPASSTAEDRSREWQLPVRVLRTTDGQLQLLNRDELEVRLDKWLKAADLTREACGSWYFTWNAFKVECDPRSALQAVEAVDLRSAELRDGASYKISGALRPGTLVRQEGAGDGSRFAASLELDPDAVRRERAEADVVIGEIMRKPVTLDEALRGRAAESISGTITVVLETDSAGNPLRRTKVTKLETRQPDGVTESQTATVTVERKRISAN